MDRIGWQFWIEDGKQLHLVLVVISDLAPAESTALRQVGGGWVVSYNEISPNIADILKLRDGDIVAVGSVDLKPFPTSVATLRPKDASLDQP
jgi:hypothetical protein